MGISIQNPTSKTKQWRWRVQLRRWSSAARWAVVSPLCLVLACESTLPSKRVQNSVQLPVPESADIPLLSERLTTGVDGAHYRVSARSLIPIAFNKQPDIKSSFQRFRSEAARYDFFFASRDSLTPRMRVTNRFGEFRDPALDVLREREHTVEFSVEKRFFDTTQMDVAVGYRTDALDDAIGNQPFVAANLRYPLWASREKLERTSEDIFRRNELDDAQLAYIQEVRSRLQFVLFRFYEVRDMARRLGFFDEWLTDLKLLGQVLDEVIGRDVTTDKRRLTAELARVTSDHRNLTGRHQIQVARFKDACGLPFGATVVLLGDPFNPFEGETHGRLRQLSIETDPEIATLRNSMRNAEVQLDLARRGTWDIALLLSGMSNVEGRGEDNGISDWSASFGIDVSHVDLRVTDSLTRQAQANIARFSQAIAARENTIYVDTLEPLVRIDTLSQSREQLKENLPRFRADYDGGIQSYQSATLNIDDLLKRRETLIDQQREISRLTFLVGANVAELCSATGKFFELLNVEQTGAPLPKPNDEGGRDR